MSSTTKAPNVNHVDVGIAGGGIAGLWLLNLLSNKGYSVVLFEQHALGSDQTLASQGMIHGGIKYALGGKLTGASEAIANMPSRWRACLEGSGEVNLSGLRLLAERYHMFANRSAMGKLTTFLASHALRGRIDKLPAAQWPPCFSGFSGIVYALNDFVLDTDHLLRALSEPWADRIMQLQLNADTVTPTPHGYSIKTAAGECVVDTLISCAGNGSQRLAEALELTGLDTQQRPLKQVIVRPRHNVLMQAHCVTGITGNEPRLTITSRSASNTANGPADGVVWYLGGLLADSGTARTDQEQIAFAQRELDTCVPWLDWRDATWEIFDVDRAEPQHTRGLKPDEASVRRSGNFLQCFPIKLTLAPDLGDKVLATLAPPANYRQPSFTNAEVKVGRAPW